MHRPNPTTWPFTRGRFPHLPGTDAWWLHFPSRGPATLSPFFAPRPPPRVFTFPSPSLPPHPHVTLAARVCVIPATDSGYLPTTRRDPPPSPRLHAPPSDRAVGVAARTHESRGGRRRCARAEIVNTPRLRNGHRVEAGPGRAHRPTSSNSGGTRCAHTDTRAATLRVTRTQRDTTRVWEK